MFTTYLNELQMLEAQAQEDSDIRVKFAAATSSETGSASSQLVYFTLEPGTTTGRHSHSAEETLLVLEGTLEVLVGDERQQLSTGGVAVFPAGVVHETPNAGSEPFRGVVFFSSAAVLHTWEVPLVPIGSRAFVTPPPEAENTETST